jgi:hypothetical protein
MITGLRETRSAVGVGATSPSACLRHSEPVGVVAAPSPRGASCDARASHTGGSARNGMACAFSLLVALLETRRSLSALVARLQLAT